MHQTSNSVQSRQNQQQVGYVCMIILDCRSQDLIVSIKTRNFINVEKIVAANLSVGHAQNHRR